MKTIFSLGSEMPGPLKFVSINTTCKQRQRDIYIKAGASITEELVWRIFNVSQFPWSGIQNSVCYVQHMFITLYDRI